MSASYRPTDQELEAAFLAARGHGKILDDDVLTAILLAADRARKAAILVAEDEAQS